MLAEKLPWHPLKPDPVTLNVRPSAASVAPTATASPAVASGGQPVANSTSASKRLIQLPFVTGI